MNNDNGQPFEADKELNNFIDNCIDTEYAKCPIELRAEITVILNMVHAKFHDYPPTLAMLFAFRLLATTMEQYLDRLNNSRRSAWG